MQVIPPGMEFHHIVAHDGDTDADMEDYHSGSQDPPIWGEVRFTTLICINANNTTI